MRPNPTDLPAALRHVARNPGLEFLPFLQSGITAFPIACDKLPIFRDQAEVAAMPVQMNFHAVTLDLDREADRLEYEKTMTYLASGYGMRVIHIVLLMVTKKRISSRNGGLQRRKVRRVYLEYYAPYRVPLPTAPSME
jgi:hypothetical protein